MLIDGILPDFVSIITIFPEGFKANRSILSLLFTKATCLPIIEIFSSIKKELFSSNVSIAFSFNFRLFNS